MNKLIGDIGNTDTKLVIINNNFKIIKRIIFSQKDIPNDKFLINILNKFLKNSEIVKLGIFSSVSPNFFKKLRMILTKKFKIKVKELKKINLSKIIKIKVNKRQVGSDRIANAIGSYYFYKQNCIILDFGTATTFDIVINGVYKGGVIAPGVRLSLQTLIKNAEQIPLFSLKKINKVIGNNTLNALRSGFFWGYNGLINNIIRLIKIETKSKFKIILTGGFSYLFKDSIKSKIIIDKDITIKGLIKILQINNKLK